MKSLSKKKSKLKLFYLSSGKWDVGQIGQVGHGISTALTALLRTSVSVYPPVVRSAEQKAVSDNYACYSFFVFILFVFETFYLFM